MSALAAALPSPKYGVSPSKLATAENATRQLKWHGYLVDMLVLEEEAMTAD